MVIPEAADGTRSAYVKIADGCSAPCAFCAIPSIKGPLRSRPVDEIVAEVRELAARGAREVTLLGQNVDSYGHDLPPLPGTVLTKCTGGSANAWWWHSVHDTLDKADVEILALDTKISLT